MLDITNVGLSQQLNGNPTFATLQKIAKALEVPITSLFSSDRVTGFIKANGVIHEINSIEDIKKLMESIGK